MDVKFSEVSQQDFREIAGYLIENAGTNVANNVIDEIERVIYKVLAHSPGLGTQALDSMETVLSFPAGKYPVYQIYYQLYDDVLEVYRVLHGRRNVDKILE